MADTTTQVDPTAPTNVWDDVAAPTIGRPWIVADGPEPVDSKFFPPDMKKPKVKKMPEDKEAKVLPHPFHRHTRAELLKAVEESHLMNVQTEPTSALRMSQDTYFSPRKALRKPNPIGFLDPKVPGTYPGHIVVNEVGLVEGFYGETLLQLRGYNITLGGVDTRDCIHASRAPDKLVQYPRGRGCSCLASSFPRTFGDDAPCGWPEKTLDGEKSREVIKATFEAIAPLLLSVCGNNLLEKINTGTPCTATSATAQMQDIRKVFGDPLGLMNQANQGYSKPTKVTIQQWQYLSVPQWFDDTDRGWELGVGHGGRDRVLFIANTPEAKEAKELSIRINKALADDYKTIKNMPSKDRMQLACWAIRNKITPHANYKVEGSSI